jgi:hypothetical protein
VPHLNIEINPSDILPVPKLEKSWFRTFLLSARDRHFVSAACNNAHVEGRIPIFQLREETKKRELDREKNTSCGYKFTQIKHKIMDLPF